MAQTAQKFLFDRRFDQPKKGAPAPEPAEDDAWDGIDEQDEGLLVPEEPPEPTFSAADLAEARAAGEAAARDKALHDASLALEKQRAEALTAIQARMADAEKAVSANVERLERDALDLVRAALARALPALAARDGMVEVVAFVKEHLDHVLDEARLVIQVGPDHGLELEPALREAAQAAGFEGRLVVKRVDDLGPSDARVAWKDGGAKRSFDTLLEGIDAIITRNIPAVEATEAPPAEAAATGDVTDGDTDDLLLDDAEDNGATSENP